MRSLPLTRPLAAALAMAFASPAALAAPAAGADAEASASGDSALATTAASGATAAPLAAAPVAAELDAVEVTGERVPRPTSPKMSQPLLETPQTVTIVPSEMMQQQGVTSLREALGNVPGISLQAGEGGVPAGDNLTLRGFSARTDLFVDGVRDFGGYSRDPFNIEQIEVIKGPSSTHSGRGSTGGSINLASKTARVDDAFAAGSLTVGSADLWRLTADLNQPFGDDAALRVNVLAHDGGIAGRDAVRSERWGVAPTLHVGLGDAATLDLSLFHLEQDNVPDYGHPWVPVTNNAIPLSRNGRAPVDRGNWYGLRDRDYEDTSTDLATAIVHVDLGDTWSLRNLTRWGEATRDSIITAPRFLGDNSTAIRRTAKLRDSEDSIVANVTDFSATFGDGDVRHQLLLGAEFARESSSNDARAATDGDLADLWDPDHDAPYTGTITDTPLADTDADADSMAVYAFDTVEIGTRWEVSGGVRWDRFDVAAEGLDTTTNTRREWARDDTMVSGRAAVLYKPDDVTSWYFALGNSFNPSAEGLALNTSTAALEPEKSRTFELGGKWSLWNDRLLLTSAIFRTEKTNARTTDADAITVLQGEQRVDGFEIGATGRLGERWTVFGGYTFMDGEVVHSLDPLEDGNELGNTPEHSASLWTTFEASERLLFGFGARHVGARWTNTQNIREAKAYTTFDAMMSFELHPSTTLRVNGYNLSDKDYVETVGGGHYTPGAARSFMASLDFSF